MNELNVIADVAGQYKALMELVSEMPKAPFLFVGDIIDRGPQSKEVVEWVRKNAKCLLGNHCHMMLDQLRYGHTFYHEGCWYTNGGKKTMDSFGWHISEDVLDWVETLPLYYKFNDILITHAFIPYDKSLEEACDITPKPRKFSAADPLESTVLWSRDEPIRRPEYSLQIAGHNSHFGLRRFDDEQGTYAIGIDDSGEKKLTGIHLPSMQIFQKEFIK